MAGTVTLEQLADWVARFRDLVVLRRDHLTDLDSAIGDADHGINMARGMDAVVSALAHEQTTSAGELFKLVGMTLVSSVGGASGPLYGTFFLRFGASAGPGDQLDSTGLATAVRSGLDGIVARGKAAAGDKTMVDAVEPALAALDAGLAQGASLAGAAQMAATAAASGRDATEPMQARKGRASYLGERSVGHVDPGAASAALLFEALAGAVAAS